MLFFEEILIVIRIFTHAKVAGSLDLTKRSNCSTSVCVQLTSLENRKWRLEFESRS